jgi:predicted NBD/HSP70 family sugar kinase
MTPMAAKTGAAAMSRDTGSQKALRERNMGLVLGTLRSQGPRTQAGLARVTGLSPGTVSSIVRELEKAGLVTTAATVSSGRRSVQVSLAPDPRAVVGVDIGRTHMRMLLWDAARRQLGEVLVSLPSGHEPPDTLPLAAQTLEELLVEHHVDRSRVIRCGVALPASLDPATGRVVQASVLPNWAGVNLRDALRDALCLPVVLENDANLGALAHYGSGRHAGAHSLIYLKVATGVGAGLAVDGVLYTSTSGITGEIGHVPVVDNGEVCYCGNRGCLETLVSTRRILGDLARTRPGRHWDVAEVVRAAQGGDVMVHRLLYDAGAALGLAVAPMCNVLSPDVVVLGGPLAGAGQAMLDGMVATVRQRALPAATARTSFTLTELDDVAEVQGACLLALHDALPSGDVLVSNR